MSNLRPNTEQFLATPSSLFLLFLFQFIPLSVTSFLLVHPFQINHIPASQCSDSGNQIDERIITLASIHLILLNSTFKSYDQKHFLSTLYLTLTSERPKSVKILLRLQPIDSSGFEDE